MEVRLPQQPVASSLYSAVVCIVYLPMDSEQSCGLITQPLSTDKRTDVWSRPSCIYTQIFSPKKNWFFLYKKNSQFFFDFCLPLFYAAFQCGP